MSSSPGKRTVTTEPSSDDAVRGRRLADFRGAQQHLQLADARLLLALLLLGRVIPAVLAQVAFLPRGLDSLHDLRTPRPGEVLQLVDEAVVRLLGEPGLGRGVGHGDLSSAGQVVPGGGCSWGARASLELSRRARARTRAALVADERSEANKTPQWLRGSRTIFAVAHARTSLGMNEENNERNEQRDDDDG